VKSLPVINFVDNYPAEMKAGQVKKE